MELIRVEVLLDRKFIELLIPSMDEMANNLMYAAENNSSLTAMDKAEIAGHIVQINHFQSILSYQLKKYEENKRADARRANDRKSVQAPKVLRFINRILFRRGK